jgi:hypothetical protein
MNIKTRLIKLEENHAERAKQQVTYESSEDSRLKLDNLIRSIKEGTHKSREPWVIRPVPPGTGPAGTFLHNTLNRIAENKPKNQIG